MTTRPNMNDAMAAFLAKGGTVKVTAPATAEAQRQATIDRRKADAAAERAALDAQCAPRHDAVSEESRADAVRRDNHDARRDDWYRRDMRGAR